MPQNLGWLETNSQGCVKPRSPQTRVTRTPVFIFLDFGGLSRSSNANRGDGGQVRVGSGQQPRAIPMPEARRSFGNKVSESITIPSNNESFG